MSIRDYDPLAIVVDWLDFCRSAEAGLLLSLYDEEAVIECECEQASLSGRCAVEAYWHSKLQKKCPQAFDLEDLKPVADRVILDHRNHKGQSVRIHFSFTDDGRILHTTCICSKNS